jgi:hypothetical protein
MPNPRVGDPPVPPNPKTTIEDEEEGDGDEDAAHVAAAQ